MSLDDWTRLILGVGALCFATAVGVARTALGEHIRGVWGRHISEPRRRRRQADILDALGPPLGSLDERIELLRVENADQHAAVEERLSKIETRSAKRFDRVDHRIERLEDHIIGEASGG